MPQVRFNIGVPGAGSAARDAEQSREIFRSLRPQAGSAARQAEEERRRERDTEPRRPANAVIRMRTPATPASSSLPSAGHEPTPAIPVAAAPVHQASTQANAHFVETSAAQTGAPAVETPGDTPHPLASANPLQTAGAKFKSLFRSLLSRGTSEN